VAWGGGQDGGGRVPRRCHRGGHRLHARAPPAHTVTPASERLGDRQASAACGVTLTPGSRNPTNRGVGVALRACGHGHLRTTRLHEHERENESLQRHQGHRGSERGVPQKRLPRGKLCSDEVLCCFSFLNERPHTTPFLLI